MPPEVVDGVLATIGQPGRSRAFARPRGGDIVDPVEAGEYGRFSSTVTSMSRLSSCGTTPIAHAPAWPAPAVRSR